MKDLEKLVQEDMKKQVEELPNDILLIMEEKIKEEIMERKVKERAEGSIRRMENARLNYRIAKINLEEELERRKKAKRGLKTVWENLKFERRRKEDPLL